MLSFIYEMFHDKVKGRTSATRVMAFIFGLSAVAFAFRSPENHITTAELVVASLTCLGLRTRRSEENMQNG